MSTPLTDEARAIRALQIEAEPDFEANHEALYQAMLLAQSKIRICPEYDELARQLVEATAAFSAHGNHIVKRYRCQSSLDAAEFAFAAQCAASAAQAERHSKACRDSYARNKKS